MRPKISTITALILLSVAAPAAARSTSQFRKFFPAWNGYLLNIIDNECQEQRDKYFDPSNGERVLSYQLANCLLDGMEEFRKTEMGITSVILGLLPTMLQTFGPTVVEVSVLASRRPLLAFLLGIAMPSVSTGGPLANPAESLRRTIDFRIRSHVLPQARWAWLLISVSEYLIAAAAAANVFYQVYQLAYWSISVSAIAVDSGTISETYTPCLWLLLLIPVHLLSFWRLKLRYKPSEETADFEKQKSWLRAVKNKGLLSIAVQFWTDIASAVVFIFSTVALSSQIFISLGDVVPIIARFLIGTLVCRAVLLFELHGLREVTSQSQKDAIHSGYESVCGQDGKGVTAELGLTL
ncbi:conserved hypothetical protein [Microsporum canis CBS 113480]|uniref:Solute carrier family 40 protein n=1 Tax=Arthroderma otae (strain ATCC MYA-4605 / CBS 113480) TaxID=554155 RepID=C5FXA3_ARTOC|nr:conserved hypothetical protein [Microsporum canis CBS 113480]EEQ34943.1 conserved hypothetical protein [Microsporum canis CBS 113480]